MTRNDFELIARAVRETTKGPTGFSVGETDREAFAHSLADMCAAQNPRFDRARFLKACGVEGAA
jgi:hypothetical protein